MWMFNILFIYFRRFLIRTDTLQVPDVGITAMIEVITMVIERGIGTFIQGPELLGAAMAAAKLKSRTQDQTG